MLRFLRQKVFPIGLDLGSASLKMVQLARTGDGLALVAAAQQDVPHALRHNPAAMQEWTIETIRNLLTTKPFKGRKVISCLPSRDLLVQHLRVAKMEPHHLEKALRFEAVAKVPFNVNQGRLCHLVAGEVYDGNESKLEVILMAASASVVARHLNIVERTKVEIASVNVEPCALVNCFAHLFADADPTEGATMFVDLGHACTKVIITHGRDIAFCRTIGIAGKQMLHAICDQQSLEQADAVPLLCSWNSQLTKTNATMTSASQHDTQDTNGIALATATEHPDQPAAHFDEDTRKDQAAQSARVEEALVPTLDQLYRELRSCIRYHDVVFGGQRVAKVIFLGGLAKNKSLCQYLARGLRLPAQVADPLARIKTETLIGDHSDLVEADRYSEWAIALGLSLNGADAI